MRQKLLEQPTGRQSQVTMDALTADFDNDQTDEQPIVPTTLTKNIEQKPINHEDQLFIHYTHEKRFQSCKRDLHAVYTDVFKDTPGMYTKLIVGNRNRRDARNELIRKRPKKTLLTNTMTKSKSYRNIFLCK
jgi:hypothetical protein